jgi:biotin synthase-like enzyme
MMELNLKIIPRPIQREKPKKKVYELCYRAKRFSALCKEGVDISKKDINNCSKNGKYGPTKKKVGVFKHIGSYGKTLTEEELEELKRKGVKYRNAWTDTPMDHHPIFDEIAFKKNKFHVGNFHKGDNEIAFHRSFRRRRKDC